VNASKVVTHLAVLEGMDKKTGPRYQPRLNILGCFTLVHAFRAGKPQKPRCAMILSTHTGLWNSPCFPVLTREFTHRFRCPSHSGQDLQARC